MKEILLMLEVYPLCLKKTLKIKTDDVNEMEMDNHTITCELIEYIGPIFLAIPISSFLIEFTLNNFPLNIADNMCSISLHYRKITAIYK